MSNIILKCNEIIKPSGIITCTKRDWKTGEILSVNRYDNLIVNVWKNATANRYGQVGNDCDITYGAVGTDGTAPTVSDTTLTTELDRSLITDISASSNVVTFYVFFDAADANGTLLEFGAFGEAATSSADSGTMVNHVLINEIKSSSQTLLFQCKITVS